jgi:glucose-1-phosphate cytidylyltransferase
MAAIKAVILAGGMGTRLIEETRTRPKPLVEIGGMPILWHVMKIYSGHGINDFIVCCGYKGHMIKEFFANYFLHRSDVTFDIAANRTEWHDHTAEPWRVTLIDTGDHSQTGGRLKRVARFIKDDPLFCFTYGDGVGDIDVTGAIAFHREQGTLATVTAVQPPGRFGSLSLDRNRILNFNEKPSGDNAWISGGFFVLSPKVLDLIEGDDTTWERGPMERLAREGNLAAYRHAGFWHPMDSMRDKAVLEELWDAGRAPWKSW